jgi:hypothetical protein
MIYGIATYPPDMINSKATAAPAVAQTDDSSDSTTAEATDAPTADPVSHNGSAKVGGMSYHIDSIETMTAIGGDDYTAPTLPKGIFIVLRLTVSNHSDSAASISSSDFKLVGANDEEYAPSSDVEMTNGGFFLENLNPGLTTSGNIAFDVPTSVPVSSFKLVVYGNGDGSSDMIAL